MNSGGFIRNGIQDWRRVGRKRIGAAGGRGGADGRWRDRFNSHVSKGDRSSSDQRQVKDRPCRPYGRLLESPPPKRKGGPIGLIHGRAARPIMYVPCDIP